MACNRSLTMSRVTDQLAVLAIMRRPRLIDRQGMDGADSCCAAQKQYAYMMPIHN